MKKSDVYRTDFWRNFNRRDSPSQPCQANHIIVDRSNTFEHELTKALISVMIAKGIPAHIYEDIKTEWGQALQNLKDTLDEHVVDEKGRVFYTEAERKDSGDVIDVVDLSDDQVEIEVMFKNDEQSVYEKYEQAGRYCAEVPIDF